MGFCAIVTWVTGSGPIGGNSNCKIPPPLTVRVEPVASSVEPPKIVRFPPPVLVIARGTPLPSSWSMINALLVAPSPGRASTGSPMSVRRVISKPAMPLVAVGPGMTVNVWLPRVVAPTVWVTPAAVESRSLVKVVSVVRKMLFACESVRFIGPESERTRKSPPEKVTDPAGLSPSTMVVEGAPPMATAGRMSSRPSWTSHEPSNWCRDPGRTVPGPVTWMIVAAEPPRIS